MRLEKSPFCLIMKSCWCFQNSVGSWVSFSSPKPLLQGEMDSSILVHLRRCPILSSFYWQAGLLVISVSDSTQVSPRPFLIVLPPTTNLSLGQVHSTAPADTSDTKANRQTLMPSMWTWKENTIYDSRFLFWICSVSYRTIFRHAYMLTLVFLWH